MTKKQRINRKQKWRNITLNKANIDEYLQDLYNDTSGNYITQGVSFNKDDNFQMSLLRNALIAHGSFSGFVKSLLHAHFEKHGKLDDTIWQPNEILEEEEELEDEDSSSSSPAPLVEEDSENDNDIENENITKTNDTQDEVTTTTEPPKEPELKKEPEKKQEKKRIPRKTPQNNGVSNAERASNYSL